MRKNLKLLKLFFMLKENVVFRMRNQFHPFSVLFHFLHSKLARFKGKESIFLKFFVSIFAQLFFSPSVRLRELVPS